MSYSPLRPLSVGNVVSAGTSLYRSHFKLYFGIALRATLWLIVPSLAINILLIFLSNSANIGRPIDPSAMWLSVLIWLPFFIYGIAKYITNSALISRLSFGDLIAKPENFNDASRQLNSRKWSFLYLGIQVGLLLVLAYIVLAIPAFILYGIGLAVLTPIFPQIVSIILAGILPAFILLGGIIWFVSRWILTEVILAVEPESKSSESIARSWSLTQSHVMRVQGIVTVAFLVTLPILTLTSYIPETVLTKIQPGSSLYWTAYAIFSVINLISSALILPFWQTVKAVLYYDLRSRREGLGLQLRQNHPEDSW